ncbi:hypothetical protein BDV97DRAFT_71411 [Delphinella strobiligena]|nr:hypothetical protein BDV97DRAFT_71411 [Delphinella strobiligena]
MPAKRHATAADNPTPKRPKPNEPKKPSEQTQITAQAGSHDEKAKLRAWLDKRGKDPKSTSPFTVTTGPIPKRIKGGKSYSGLTEQLKLGGKEHMRVAYNVSPMAQWMRLNKYKKFTLPNAETHEVGSCVFVNHSDNGGETLNPDDQWKAQVLEVRALDENHVYLRVAWLEIPSELPNGAGRYHAENELIPSNEMAIVDASTVQGGFKISYWDETNDEAPLPDPEEYFWRQGFDKHTRQLSKLREMCECGDPHNPSELIINCDACKKWLHARCIIDDAKKRATNDLKQNSTSKTSKKRREGSTKIGTADGIGHNPNPRKGKSGANQEEANEEDIEVEMPIPKEGERPKLLIKKSSSKTGEAREEDIHCLLCKTLIE